MVGPVVATTPPATAQQADAKFFAKNPVVNERIFSKKNDYDRILSQTKLKLPIDTVVGENGWKLGLTLNANGRVLKTSMGCDFSFGNRTEVLATSTWGPNEGFWLGSNPNSIDGKFKAVKEDGSLSVIFTANAWDSKVRTIILRDGEQPVFIFNNGVKDTSDKGCIVQFLNVQESGDDISLSMRLVKDFTSQGGVVADENNPVFFPPNFKFSGLVEASGVQQVQNWMSGRVVKDTTVKVTKGNYPNYSYAYEKMENILLIDIVNNYKLTAAWARYVYTSGEYDGQTSGALLLLGRRNGKYPASYVKFVGVAQDADAYTLDPTDATQIGLGGEPSSKVNVFGSLNASNDRARLFVLRTGNNVWTLGGGSTIGIEISRPMNDPTAPWTLTNSMLDSGTVVKLSGALFTSKEKTGTEFIIDYNLRVRVIGPQEFVIEDISTESLLGDKVITTNTAVTPFERSQDTTDVIDPIARSSVLKVYPNPAHDQLIVEVTGQGQTWVNIVDMYGRVVKNVYNGVLENGTGTFPLNTNDLPSGVYFLHERGTQKSETIKIEVVH